MFKKLFVFLILILFISQISFVTANDNTTSVLNENTDIICYKVSNISCITENFELNEDSNILDDYNHSYYCYQGDEILIHIDSFEEGNLEVLVDNEYLGSWNFTLDETISIPTYAPESFYDDSKTNICVGMHDIRLMFNFNSMNNYFAIIDEDSLNFVFIKNTDNVLTNTLTWNSELYIKEKNPPEIEFTLQKFHIYEEIAHFYIWFNDDWLGEYNANDSIGIIVSNKTGIIYKNNITHSEYNNYNYYDGFFIHFNITDAGIYNWTAVNLMTGATRSVLFEIIKYNPEYQINYSINGSTFVFEFEQIKYWYLSNFTICVDNITKIISNWWRGEVVFDNLNPGVHVLTFYCPEDGFSESFFYKMIFEINGTVNASDEEDNNISDNNNTDTNNTIDNTTNLAGQGNSSDFVGNSSNSNGGNTYPRKNYKNENFNSKKNHKSRLDNSQELTVGGDDIISDFSSVSNSKTYEIQGKSASKSIDESLTKIALILIIIISFIMGYFKYKRKLR